MVRSEAVERELEEELAFHLEMETGKNVRAGMSAQEARRRAVLEFGGVERFKEEVRDARWLGWASGLSLDFRLGLRMLVKHPGLTLVGSLAIAFAIWVGVGTFEFASQVVFPTLPFDEGDRVVGIRSWDAAASRGGRRGCTTAPGGGRSCARWRGWTPTAPSRGTWSRATGAESRSRWPRSARPPSR